MRRLLLLLTATATLALTGACLTAYVATTPAGPGAPTDAPPEPGWATFTLDGRPMRVHALPTGTIAIKRCHHEGCLDPSTPYPLRFLRILADTEFVAPMPIWTYLIEHPEGRFVIDTGGDTRWHDPQSWSCDPGAGRVARSMARVSVRPEETLLARLAALKLSPQDIRAAIITHLHFDHTGGILSLSRPTLVGAGDLEVPEQIGATPCRFFAGAALEPIAPKGALTDPRGGRALTRDGRLRVYATPGHTHGSLTLRLRTDQGDLWFVGDTTFTQDGVREGAPTAGIHMGMDEIRAQHATYRQLLRTTPSALFPSHDPDVVTRLQAFTRRR